ncbi:uncharacterized protein [Littorina saxatilis]|uniref:uncharacterized protein n=1 Tax=Littorina saxatilis TaxID=31220 RepID=UPI0038B6A4C4
MTTVNKYQLSVEEKNGLDAGQVDVFIKGRVTDSGSNNQSFSLYFSLGEIPLESPTIPYCITVQFDGNANTANNVDIEYKRGMAMKNVLHLSSTILKKDKDFEIKLGVYPEKIEVLGIAEYPEETTRPCPFKEANFFVAEGEGLTITMFKIRPRLMN